MSSALALPNVESVVNFELTSLSRAGRNEAAHKTLTKKAAEAMEQERAIKKAAIRKKNRELAAETFEASTFGEGNTSDKKREEMCSSPRLHPQKEIQAMRDYRGQRMGVFQHLHHEVPKLDLVDVGGITDDGEKQYKEGKTPRNVEDDFDASSPLAGVDDIEEGTMHESANGQLVIKPVSPAEKTRMRLEQVASPLRSRKAPAKHDTASFLSPSRWKDSAAPKPPAVGHYRPKHGMVEHRVSGGVIQPPGTNTARAKPNYTSLKAGQGKSGAETAKTARLSTTGADLGVTLSNVAAGAKTESGRQVTNGRDASGREASLRDPSGQNEDEDGTQKKLGKPQPDKFSTSAFKSASPNRARPPKTYGADAIYWPLNDNITSSKSTDTTKTVINFSRMKGRAPLEVKTAAPDATYPLTSGLNTTTRVDMNRQAVRPPLSLPTAGDHGTQYYPDAGAAKDALKHRRVPAIDFTKTSPRKTLDHSVPSVSVEEVEGDLTEFQKKSQIVPSLDKIQGRKDAKVNINDLMYTVNDELTTHRIRGALVREGQGTGHKPLFNPTITDKCNYEPNPAAVKPKILRSIDFSKDTPRPPNDRGVQMADLVYNTDSDLTKHRLQGNPMMGSHLTRGKRNKNLTPRVYAPDTVYNVEHAGGAMGKVRDDKGAVDFTKHVPRSVVFKGRGQPSEKWLEAHPRAPGPGEYSPKAPNPAFDPSSAKKSLTGSAGSPTKNKSGNSYNIHS